MRRLERADFSPRGASAPLAGEAKACLSSIGRLKPALRDLVAALPGRALAASALLALTALAGCKRARHDPSALVPERNAPLASVVTVNDPATSAQLVRGFHAVEGGSWRWTAKDFEVALKPPEGAADKGARLVFRLNAPAAIISKFGAITLKASLNGLPLAPEIYSKPGDYVYTRDISASALKGDAVLAEFHSDKFMPPSSADARELAVIAVSFSLESP